jgi:rod shape-determining protein MreD
VDGLASAIRPTGSPAAWLLPTATTCLAALVSLQPVHIPGYAAVTPVFAIMAVYHWTIYRPDLLPPLVLFAIGVVDDLLAGGHVGITALLLLISRIALLRCRRWFFDRAFSFIWGGFALLTGGAMVGVWATEAALEFHLAKPGKVVISAVLTISIFPFASWLLGRTQRALIG